MTTFLIRVEAVNFETTINDTDDLSTMRGGSRACLLLPGLIMRSFEATGTDSLRIVFTGASQAVGILRSETASREALESRLADTIADCGRRLDRPETDVAQTPAADGSAEATRLAALENHLVLIAVAVPLLGTDDASFDAAARIAVARLRTRQLQRPTIDLDDASTRGVERACDKDGQRAARLLSRDGAGTLNLSRSTGVRRDAGRQLRRTIYRRLLGNHGGLVARLPPFAGSFEELVASPPPNLPPALVGKMAVVHFDGNRFTRLRSHHPGEDGARLFADTVEQRREVLLAGLLKMLLDDRRMLLDDVLRFELLAWGGDEATMVLPAWKARDALAFLADAFDDKDWCVGPDRLTHATALLVCSHKMPIATATSMADEMVREAKKGAEPRIDAAGSHAVNSFTLQLLDSVEPLADSLATMRELLYGSSRPTDYTISGGPAVHAMLAAADALGDPDLGFPRTKLYGLLARAGEFAGQPDADGTDRLKEAIASAIARSLPATMQTPAAADEAAEWKEARLADLTSGRFGGDGTGASLFELKRVSELWEVLLPPSPPNAEAAEVA